MHYYLHYLLQSVFYCFLLLGFTGEILIFQIYFVLLRYLQNGPIFSGFFNCRILVMSKNCENYLVNNLISLIESLLLLYHYFESAYIFLFTLLYLFVLLQCQKHILILRHLIICLKSMDII